MIKNTGVYEALKVAKAGDLAVVDKNTRSGMNTEYIRILSVEKIPGGITVEYEPYSLPGSGKPSVYGVAWFSVGKDTGKWSEFGVLKAGLFGHDPKGMDAGAVA
jgi:hypothetical protein